MFKPVKILPWPKRKPIPKFKQHFLFAGRESSMVRDEIYFTWIMNRGLKTTIRLPNKSIIDYYVDPGSWSKVHKKIADQIIKTWPSHLLKYERLKSKLLQTSILLALSVKDENNKKILNRFHNYCQAAYDFSEYVMGAWSIITHTEKEIIKKFPAYVNVINGLGKPIPYQQMQMDLWKYSPEELVKKYGWLNMYNPFIKPFSKHHFIKLRKHTRKTEIFTLKHSFLQNKKEFSNLLKAVKNKNLLAKIQAVHAYAFLKTDRVEIWKKSLQIQIPFLKYLQNKIKEASFKDACNLSIKEKTELLEKNILPNLKSLKLRSNNSSLLIYMHGKIWEFTEPKSVDQIRQSQTLTIKSAQIIKGTVAFPGKAKGKAVIIKFKKDLEKVKNHDILIAKYTMPIYAPYMAKCGAIVTDEGGITSHAAIVAREMKKPCIIGTKIATKVFKDGDMVEVDANKGIVRKI